MKLIDFVVGLGGCHQYAVLRFMGGGGGGGHLVMKVIEIPKPFFSNFKRIIDVL